MTFEMEKQEPNKILIICPDEKSRDKFYKSLDSGRKILKKFG